ncbi:hypothetical protein ACQP10_26985 [Streptosporangium sandarakinum]|uniref:hypothetical protein n=1 Tax=Streptosporangium sandarakinum TaxID=1260955 RepID=UPI003D8E75E4
MAGDDPSDFADHCGGFGDLTLVDQGEDVLQLQNASFPDRVRSHRGQAALCLGDGQVGSLEFDEAKRPVGRDALWGEPEQVPQV